MAPSKIHQSSHPPAVIYGGPIDLGPRETVLEEPKNQAAFDFLTELQGQEFFDIVKSIRTKRVEHLTLEEIDIIEEWNRNFAFTRGGTRLPRGIAESRWASPKDVELGDKAEEIFREGVKHRVGLKLASYKGAQLVAASPKSTTTGSKSESVPAESKTESISTAPSVGMALSNENENRSLPKEPFKFTKGLSDSKWATGGEVDRKFHGPSKQIPKFSQVPGDSILVNEEGASKEFIAFMNGVKGTKWEMKQSASNTSTTREGLHVHVGNKITQPSGKIPTLVSPKRSSAVVIKNPSTNEVLEIATWKKSSSASDRNSQSPTGPNTPPSNVQIQGVASIQQAPLNAQALQFTSVQHVPLNAQALEFTSIQQAPVKVQIPQPTAGQQAPPKVVVQQTPLIIQPQQTATVQPASPYVQSLQADVVQNIQSYPTSASAKQLLNKTRGVAQNKANGQSTVVETARQSASASRGNMRPATAMMAPPPSTQQGSTKPAVLQCSTAQAAIVNSTLTRSVVAVPSANAQVLQTEYVSPLFRNADGSPNQQLIDDAKKEIEERKAAGLHQNSQSISTPSIANKGKITHQQFSTRSSTQISATVPMYAMIPRVTRTPVERYVPPSQEPIDSDNEEIRKRSLTRLYTVPSRASFPPPTQPKNLNSPSPNSSLQANWNKKNFTTGANQSQAQKFNTPAAATRSNENSKNMNNVAAKPAAVHSQLPTENAKISEASYQTTLTGQKASATVADQDTADHKRLLALLSELDRPAGFWPNPMIICRRKELEDLLTQTPEGLRDSQIPAPDGLTSDALMVVFGSKPRENDPLDFDDTISNTGVAKEVIRAAQGADELLDWDGTWAPGPCDWENERPLLNKSFVPNYIREWQKDLPAGSELAVDTSTEQFSMAKEAINNGVYEVVEIQPNSNPDSINSSDNMKRTYQTSASESHNYLVAYEKREAKKQKTQWIFEAQAQEIKSRAPEHNPFSPKIPLYMRPAEEKDAAGVAEVYNHYIRKSILPEDQEELTIQDAIELIRASKSQKLPFIVSISGRVPSMTNVRGRRGVLQKYKLPQVEKVIGFAFSERFNCSLSLKINGRSRFTANLQLYVHPQYTRKGVGRNLMDRLMHTMTRSYAYKNAAEWLNTRNDAVYETEGCGTWHQILINVPVKKTDDETLVWLQPWLYHQNSFWFKEHYRMKSTARSNPNNGPALWLDVAVFQCEATHGDVFGAFE